MRVNVAILSGVEDVKEQRDTQAALLLRNGFTWRNATNKTVMVTANGHVTLTPVGDIDVALQFTIEQWNRVVEFVDNQLMSESLEQSDWVDWSKVSRDYNYVAADEDGDVHAYERKPEIDDDEWWNGGDFRRVHSLRVPTTLNWQHSLRKRPGV